MARKHRTCISCGTTYEYCPDCRDGHDHLKPTWYTEFCCEDCKELWEAATKFNMELITKDEAKKQISALQLKPASEYVECIQHDLANIFAEAPKFTKPQEVVKQTKK